MGAGIHGGFGNTVGFKAVAASPVYVGKGEGENLAVAAKYIKPETGYTDVVIHGTENSVAIVHNGEFKHIDQRRLSNLLKHDKEYKHKSDIRLISCSTGANTAGFAQNLANKLGVKVKAPSDMLWVLPGGKMVIGSTPYKNTGKWIVYTPYSKKGGERNDS